MHFNQSSLPTFSLRDAAIVDPRMCHKAIGGQEAKSTKISRCTATLSSVDQALKSRFEHLDDETCI